MLTPDRYRSMKASSLATHHMLLNIQQPTRNSQVRKEKQIAGLSDIHSLSSITSDPACNAVALPARSTSCNDVGGRAGWIFLVGYWVFTFLATQTQLVL